MSDMYVTKRSIIVPMDEAARNLDAKSVERVVEVVEQLDAEFRHRKDDPGYYCLHVVEGGFTFEGTDEIYAWSDDQR